MGVSANTLRIGNLISIGGDKMMKVVEIGTYTIRYLDNTYNDNFRAFIGYDYIKPIELTEEILLKCGFVKDIETSYRWYLDEYFTYDLDDGGFKFEGIWIEPLIKYLHQLQNLYFCLTGKELEIKL